MASESTTGLEVWLQFQYRELWLEQPQAIALSQSLPLQAKPFGDRACWPFFAGLLPER